jgi:hypothetical protein
MEMARRTDSGWIGSLRSVVRSALPPLAGNGRGLLGVAVLAIVMIAGAYMAWSKIGGAIRQRSQYRLTSESFEITPQPAWIQSDVKAEVIRDARLDELSALDPDLTKTVVQAFELHTWVAQVLWAGKRPGKNGPRIIVELRYREPIVMVRTKDDQWEGDCFWPVDTEGVFLPPGEFSSNQTSKYLRVDAGDVLPVGSVGSPYGDPGVAGAVAVATQIGSMWQSMGLEWIVVHRAKGVPVGQLGEPTFVLLPAGVDPSHTTPRAGGIIDAELGPANSPLVVWGRAPSREQPGEAKAAQKISRLQMFVMQEGRLDQLSATTVVDLRPAGSISVTSRSTTIQPASAR